MQTTTAEVRGGFAKRLGHRSLAKAEAANCWAWPLLERSRSKMSNRTFAALLIIALLGVVPSAQLGTPPNWLVKLDPLLQRRATLLTGRSPIVVGAVNAASLASVVQIIQQAGGTIGRPLPIISGQAANVPNTSLPTIASSPLVQHLALDRFVLGAMERTGPTIGATAVRNEFGYDGSGVGVAIIDSGVTPWHDDLSDPAVGAQRVDQFVDFVNGWQAPYDDYGHGTHVAGIIAGNGFDSDGARAGVAPAAHLIVLKTLDGSGRGRISDVIAALDYVVTHKDDLNIRVVNLSVATGVYESYNSDPLTLAAQRAVTSGIVVVAAAGNNGRDPQGRTQYGGITAPGNAPWVLTVGASSHMGTIDRADDTIARFSSRGPGAIDDAAKPDVVAPGVGIESLSDPNSFFYTADSNYLLSGTVATSYLPYLSLSGTSMATPIVSGTVALMLHANPALTPNAVKAILEYTAQPYPGYDALTEGAGFLNARGAVELAQFLASPSTTAYPSSSDWGAQFIWGNHLIHGAQLPADADAWSTDVVWGADTISGGQPIDWGNADSANVVWGGACGGADCQGTWGTADGDTVVWGTSDDGDTVVWGTSCTDQSCQPVVWTNP
jgi:serine protease AprX